MSRIHLWLVLVASIIVIATSALLPSDTTTSLNVPPVYGMGLPHPVETVNPAEPGHLYLITVDRLTVEDIVEFKSILDNITANSAVGLVSTGVEGSMVPDSTFASIGAGAPVNASGTAPYGMNREEYLSEIPVQSVFFQRTGITPPGNSVLQLDIARVKKLNADSKYSAKPGYLGTILRNKGIDVRVYGNSDTLNSPSRPAVSIAMDENGIVGGGDVGPGTLLRDEYFPGLLRTDYDALLSAVKKNTGKGLTIIELGDLARLEKNGARLDDCVIKARRAESINRISAFINELLETIDPEKDRVIILSPTPRGNNLFTANLATPVMVTGAGIEQGLLTSPTTRRPGIIKNTDIAPSILDYFNIETPPGMTGRLLQVIPVRDTVIGINSLYEKIEMTHQARSPVLRNYVLIHLILVILSLAVILIPGTKTLMLMLKPLLLAVMSVPLAFLLVPLLPQPSIEVMVVQIIAVTSGITAFIHLWLKNYENELDPFILISMLTSTCIAVDLLLGAPLQKYSLLGYDPIVGARFYGLGNEYMGVLLGSTIVGTTALVTRLPAYKKVILPLIAVYYLVVLYTIAAPQFGTNVGGSIAGAGSFLVTLLLLAGVRFNFETIVKIAGAVALVFITLVFYDLHRPTESQSHIGRTAKLIINGGAGEIINIIHRKLSMNIKLIRHTIWSRIFLASLFALAILFYRPVGVMQSLNSRYPELYRGFIGVVTASLLALAFNDSGVVAAATTMIFGAPPLLYLVIRTLIPVQN